MKIELTDPIFQKALPILQQIESHGYEAYFVGGCVRDTLLGNPIHDIDIASSATPDEIQSIFHVTIEVGKEHGTIIVVRDGETYEITTFRTEGTYSDYRRPDHVEFVRNLREDTLRRDYTINAMALDREGQLFDYHDGLKDLKQHLIRAVGEPHERFEEDALRMIRAIRFASQLGFDIEYQTFQAIQDLGPLIENIAVERIRIEFSKYILGNHFKDYYDLLTTTGLDKHLYFASKQSMLTVMYQLALDLRPYMEQQVEREERLAWSRLVIHLQLTDSSDINTFMRAWKHSNQFIQDVLYITHLMQLPIEELHTDWIVYRFPSDILNLVEEFYLIHNQIETPLVSTIEENLPIQSRNQLPVNGKDIMTILDLERGGPIVGELLEKVEYQVVTGQLVNEETAIINYIEQSVN